MIFLKIIFVVFSFTHMAGCHSTKFSEKKCPEPPALEVECNLFKICGMEAPGKRLTCLKRLDINEYNKCEQFLIKRGVK